MLRRVVITATYEKKAQDVFLAALDLNEMSDAMSGLAEYKGLPDQLAQEGETYTVDVTTLKVFKTKNYEMFIEQVDKGACILQSREKGGAIRMWDHRLSVSQEGEMATWTDDVTIDAGLITPLLARFGAYMYKRRHKYRRALSISSDVSRIK